MTTDAVPTTSTPMEPEPFTAVIEAGTLRAWLGSMKQVCDEVKVHYDRIGMSAIAVDPAHVCMLTTTLSRESFLSYHNTEGELALDLDDARRMVSAVKGSMTEVRLDTAKGKLTMEWEVKGDRFKVSKVLPDGTGMRDPKVPNLNMPVKFTITRAQLDDLLSTWKKLNMSDHVRIEHDGGEIAFMQDNDRTNGDAVQRPHVDLTDHPSFKVGSVFPLNYLESVITGLKPMDKVKVHIGDNFPVIFEAERNGMALTYWIAPRIVSGD